MFKKGDMVEIREGWDGKGRRGVVVGPVAQGGDRDDWTPVLWEDEDDPTFFKGEGLIVFISKPVVLSIEFRLGRDQEIYAEKVLSNGTTTSEKIGHTPVEIRNWMHKIAKNDDIDLNEALRKVFGEDQP